MLEDSSLAASESRAAERGRAEEIEVPGGVAWINVVRLMIFPRN